MLRSFFQRRNLHSLNKICTVPLTLGYRRQYINLPMIYSLQRQRYGTNLFVNHRKFHVSTSCLERAKQEEEEPEAQVLNPKHQLLIGFTCKVCEVRSHHVMSKQAYTKGVVLIQCPECKNRHLIADNLGWFKDTKTNVEDLVKEKGEAIRKIVVDNQGKRLPVEHLMEWVPDITAEEEQKVEEAKIKAKSKLDKEKEE
ncbi:DNL zinc finger-domain-containing protein [Halteromyces radiatus]|uniref:DNL zinc finger-domain-containing protein n=1 Tax=Halteromyces radiatus TaxID=101107 RepID=UPI00221F2BC8|nr:DNL zinc finger-domain-containing protein [Halteromyces radiatus]KAI8086117.1 DNL zinc finger-domain-containing protein [Halteromyces radiatus]